MQHFFSVLLLLLWGQQGLHAQNCTLTANGFNNLACNDNGTPNDANDDYMTFELNPTGTNLGSGYSVLVPVSLSPITLLNGAPANNVPYGVTSLFRTPIGTSTTSGTLGVRDISTNCLFPGSITATGPCSVNAPPPCSLTATGFTALECNNNGTPNNSTDDFMTFALNPEGTNLGATGYEVLESTAYQQLTLAAGGSFTILPYNTVTFFRTPNGTADINGSLVVRDAVNGTCTVSQSITATGNCSIPTPPCDLVSSGFGNVQCNNNGTPNNSSDDYITCSMNPTGVNLGTGYKVLTNANLSPITLLNGTSAMNVPYGAITSFRTPNGTASISGTIVITDMSDNSCVFPINFTAPGTCSSSNQPCTLTDSGLSNITCNNNGTPSSPADDYIVFSLQPLGSNLGSGYGFEAAPGFPIPTNLNGSPAQNIAYGAAATFRLANGTASGPNGDYQILIVDDSGDCSLEESINAPGTCSSSTAACNISEATVSSASACNGNGSPSTSDDFYTADIEVSFTNPPTTGNLQVSLAGDVLEAQSISVAALLGSSHVFQGVKLRADGTPTDISVVFTANTTCAKNAVGPAVASCSVPANLTCPLGITVNCANNISSPNPNSLLVNAFCDGGISITHVGDVISNQTCTNRFTVVRTYQATGDCIPALTCVQTITVFDGIAPNITECSPNITVSCATQLPPFSTNGINVSDNCTGMVVVTQGQPDVISNQTCPNRFTISRFYRAVDACGNSSNCTQTIVILDNLFPSVSVPPANIIVECGPGTDAQLQAWLNTAGGAVAADNCGGAVVWTHSTPAQDLGCGNTKLISVVFFRADICGNTEPDGFFATFTIRDNTPPSLICPAGLSVSCAQALPLINTGSVSATDNCGGSPPTVTYVGEVNSNQTCANRFTHTRTYRATDACGNSATCSQVIIVNDQIPPSLTCPAGISVSCAEAIPPVSISTVTVVNDNCGGNAPTVAFVSDVLSNSTCTNRFTQTRTYRATDACGNSATCAQVIAVNDQIAPVFTTFPANITVDCYLAPTQVGTPTASDNCTGSVTIAYLGAVQTLGTCPVLYTITRTWRATDACGNSTSASQTITVTDQSPPNILVPPQNVVANCHTGSMADYQDWLEENGGAVSQDCTPVTWTYAESPFHTCPSMCGNTFQKYIRFTATDQCGNTAFRDASFIVVDEEPPVFVTLPQNVSMECMPDCNGEVQFSEWYESKAGLEVVDACGTVNLEIMLWKDTKGCGRTWSKTYLYKATDQCGNFAMAFATFKVEDTTPPVASCQAAPWNLSCVDDLPAPDPATVSAIDDCSLVTVTLKDIYKNGTGCTYSPMTVIYTYLLEDACGNQSTCAQQFEITDNKAPLLDLPAEIQVNCIDDIPGIDAAGGYLGQYLSNSCDTKSIKILSDLGTSANTHAFSIQGRDACGNVSDIRTITFKAIGTCKPLCTAPNDIWGAANGTIGNESLAGVIDSVTKWYGGIKIGSFGRTLQIGGSGCFDDLVSGNGDCSLIPPGQHVANTNNGCQLDPALLDGNGALKSVLLTNILSLQLNIWYNEHFNQRNLGVQDLRNLPDCTLPDAVMKKLGTHATWQDLLQLANTYLGTVNSYQYPMDFGCELNAAISRVNNLHLGCTMTLPCQDAVQNRFETFRNMDELGVKIGPNPVVDHLDIQITVDAATKGVLQVFNSTGTRVVHTDLLESSHSNLRIPLNHLSNGMYYLNVQVGTMVKTIRFVKTAE